MDHCSIHDCLGSGEEHHTVPRCCIRLAQGVLEENDIDDGKSWLKFCFHFLTICTSHWSMCGHRIYLLGYTMLTLIFFFKLTFRKWHAEPSLPKVGEWKVISNMNVFGLVFHSTCKWIMYRLVSFGPGYVKVRVFRRQITMCKLQELDRWPFRRSNFLAIWTPSSLKQNHGLKLIGISVWHLGIRQSDGVLATDIAHVGVSQGTNRQDYRRQHAREHMEWGWQIVCGPTATILDVDSGFVTG